MRALLTLILGAVLLLSALPAWAAGVGRVALVIGNSNYRKFPTLPNPKNDAEDVGAALKKVGFTVIGGADLTREAIRDALRQFARAAQDAEAALVFYAGHGLQYRGRNYLVPIDAKLEDEFDLEYETVRVDDVVEELARAEGARILILDACRNLPLAARGRDPFSSSGLAKLSGRGLIVAYATQANQVAFDGTGRNSIFTGAFVKAVAEPGLDATQMFQRVSMNVDKATGGRQTPELSLSYPGQFFFNKGETEREAWPRARASGDPDVLRDFIARFPGSFLVDDAKDLIARIEAGRGGGSRPPAALADARAPAPAARRPEDDARLKEEAERLAWQKLQDEQKRRAEARAQSEQQRAADEAKERARLAAEAKAEEERRRVEARRLELERQLEEGRQKKLAEERAVADAKERQRLAAEAKAEEARRLQEARRAEQERIAEEGRQRKLAEERAVADAKERQRLAAEAKAEEARRLQEARRAEQERIAEEGRQKKLAEEAAATDAKERQRLAAEAKAEEARRLQEARRAELDRAAEEARQRKLAEEAAAADARERQRLASEARAEEARRLQEARRAEQERIAEEARQRKLAEDVAAADARERQRLAAEARAEEGRRLQEARRLEADRLAEEARQRKLAQDAAAAEAQRRPTDQFAAASTTSPIVATTAGDLSPEERDRLAWQRLEEEQRRRALTAADATPAASDGSVQTTLGALKGGSVPATPDRSGATRLALADPTAPVLMAPAPAPTGPSEALDRDRLVRETQAELGRIGCTDDTPDGEWDKDSRDALRRFGRQAKLTPIPTEPSAALLDDLKGRPAQFCPLECGPGEKIEGERCVAVARPDKKPKPKAVAQERREPAPARARPTSAPVQAPTQAAAAPRPASRPMMGVGF